MGAGGADDDLLGLGGGDLRAASRDGLDERR